MSWFGKSNTSGHSNGSSSANRQSVNGAAASVASVGVVPRAVQLDFEREEKKIHQFESTNKKFYKDVKYYVEKIEELNKSEAKMINNLSNLSSTSNHQSSSSSSNVTANLQPQTQQAQSNNSNVLVSNDLINIGSSNEQSDHQSASTQNDKDFLLKLKLWKDLLDEHNKSCESLKHSCQTQVIEPMKKLNTIFPTVYTAIKRREQTYNELLKQQAKLDKAQERERTGVNLVRIEQLKQLVQIAKQQFQKEHLFLMEELPKLYNSRLDYIRPCVNSLLQSQANFYENYSKFYDSILNCHSANEQNQQQSQNQSRAEVNNNFSASLSSFSMTSSSSTNNNTNSQSNSNQTNLAKNTLQSNSAMVSTDQIDEDIQKCLSEIKSLSIVAGD
jgi:hypothetical protein